MAYTDIDKSDDYFNTVIWTGNDTSPRTITGVNFQPDFTWTKRRDSGDGNTNHNLYNSIVGAGNNTELVSNGTFAEGGSLCNLYGYLSAFTSDGFTLTDGTDGTYEDLYTNQSGGTYVSWNWLAGGSASSNTDGSITSNVSANTTSGFSIVSYTGTGANATVGHGLGVAPKMIICKGRSFSSAAHWLTYHEAMGNTSAMKLNLTSAKETTFFYWNNTSPTSSTFSLGASTEANSSSETFIAYCFAEKKGFSKFGSYTGNGNSDGPFIYTGFKPAFVLVKLSSGVDDWQILDNKRNTYNVMNEYLRPNSSGATTTNDVVDFVSNGFKHRSSLGSWNPSGGTFIYMAFAENPFVTSTGIPTTAR